ncbi:MAG: hypothetical protein J6036_04705 [Clostridia bacterium]|nr:hypothetical protein [Clostridia bacterium]
MLELRVMLCVAVCLLALYGIYEIVKKIFDIYVQKKSGVVCDVIIKKCRKEYVEYALRFAESRFCYGDCRALFENLILSKNIQNSENIVKKLNDEFGNVRSGK